MLNAILSLFRMIPLILGGSEHNGDGDVILNDYCDLKPSSNHRKELIATGKMGRLWGEAHTYKEVVRFWYRFPL